MKENKEIRVSALPTQLEDLKNVPGIDYDKEGSDRKKHDALGKPINGRGHSGKKQCCTTY